MRPLIYKYGPMQISFNNRNEVSSIHIYKNENERNQCGWLELLNEMADSANFLKKTKELEIDFIEDSKHTIQGQQKGYINNIGIVVVFRLEDGNEVMDGIHYSK